MNKTIVYFLLERGAKPNCCGFRYAHDAIEIYLKAEKPIRITKDIYSPLAEKYNTTPQNIERGIRHLVETLPNAQQHFSNSLFLSSAALELKLDAQK